MVSLGYNLYSFKMTVTVVKYLSDIAFIYLLTNTGTGSIDCFCMTYFNVYKSNMPCFVSENAIIDTFKWVFLVNFINLWMAFNVM